MLINSPKWTEGPDRRERRFIDVPYSDEYEEHAGNCCSSCIEDKELGYGDDIDGCCCRAERYQ